jgi:threonine synthase
VARRFLHDDVPMICLATAHPAKFGDAVRQATGRELAHHPVLDALAGLPTRCEELPADAGALRAFIEAHAGACA